MTQKRYWWDIWAILNTILFVCINTNSGLDVTAVNWICPSAQNAVHQWNDLLRFVRVTTDITNHTKQSNVIFLIYVYIYIITNQKTKTIMFKQLFLVASLSVAFALNTCGDYRDMHGDVGCCGEAPEKVDNRVVQKDKANDFQLATVICKFTLLDTAFDEGGEVNMTYLNGLGWGLIKEYEAASVKNGKLMYHTHYVKKEAKEMWVMEVGTSESIYAQWRESMLNMFQHGQAIALDFLDMAAPGTFIMFSGISTKYRAKLQTLMAPPNPYSSFVKFADELDNGYYKPVDKRDTAVLPSRSDAAGKFVWSAESGFANYDHDDTEDYTFNLGIDENGAAKILTVPRLIDP